MLPLRRIINSQLKLLKQSSEIILSISTYSETAFIAVKDTFQVELANVLLQATGETRISGRASAQNDMLSKFEPIKYLL